MCPYCSGLLCVGGVTGRDPCPLSPEWKPVARYTPCGKCGVQMHPLQNARVVGTKVICMPCYEKKT